MGDVLLDGVGVVVAGVGVVVVVFLLKFALWSNSAKGLSVVVVVAGTCPKYFAKFPCFLSWDGNSMGPALDIA